jgi:hypothetical protein
MRRFAMVWLFPFVYYPWRSPRGAAGTRRRRLVGGATGFAAGFLAGCLVLAAAGAFGRRNFAYLFLNDWIFNRAVALTARRSSGRGSTPSRTGRRSACAREPRP